MSVYESEIGRCFTGDFDLWIGDSPVEEPTRLQPREPIAGNFVPVAAVSARPGSGSRR